MTNRSTRSASKLANAESTKLTNGASKVRCAIYARKSTDEDDANFRSTDAQVEYCTKYSELQTLEGWKVSEAYIDSGFSGGNTKRPALKRLLADIEGGLIDVVIVHRLDRFSRSLSDFMKIWEVLKAHEVNFVSVTEKFDTSTPMGRLTMQLLAVFAEFELASATQRTLAKIGASKQKGMWMGGYAPLGYDAVDKMLVINESEAETVRLIFAEFIKTKSMKLLAGLLREKGLKTKQYLFKNKQTDHERLVGGNDFSHSALYSIINNFTYNGKVNHNDNIYPGQHQAIISDEVWEAAHRTLQVNPKERAGSTKHADREMPAPLNRILKCGCCGCSMALKYTSKSDGRRYRYYEVTDYMNGRVTDCKVKRVAAPEIEAVVLAQLKQVVREPEVLVATWKNLNGEINHSKDGADAVSEDQVREALSGLDAVWKELLPGAQKQLLHTMLEKVVLGEDSIELGIKMDGLMNLAQDGDQEPSAGLGQELPVPELPASSDQGPSTKNDVVLIKVPFSVKRKGSRKLIVLPENSVLEKPQRKPDQVLVKALVKAHVWQKQISSGKFRTAQDLAKKNRIHIADVSRILVMNMLAPDIKVAILDGTQPLEMNMQKMKKQWPDEWQAQRRWFGLVDNCAIVEPKPSNMAEADGAAVREGGAVVRLAVAV